MKRNLSLIFLLALSLNTFANENVVYKYRKYERFDLGNLKIKGNIVAPGDISVKERRRKKFNRHLLERTNFDPEIKDDVFNLR